jgi:quinol monooxygenase YgiN
MHSEEKNMRCAFQFLLGMMIFPLGAVPAALAAEGAGTAYVVTYFETLPTSTGKARSLLQQLGRASRKEAGNLRFEALTQASRTNHMTVVEIWMDKKGLEGHAMAAHKKAFREKLAPLSGSLYDERLYRTID